MPGTKTVINAVNYLTLLGLTASLRVGLPASVTRFAGTTVVPERSFHSRFFGVTHSSCLDGKIPWDNARFLSACADCGVVRKSEIFGITRIFDSRTTP